MTVSDDPHVSTFEVLADECEPVDIAVYDFDGTLLAGKSPVILTEHLVKTRQMSVRNGLLIALWGLAYKMHIPPNEAWVRGRVFRAFAGQPKTKVDAYLGRFYDEKLGHRLRPSMLECIEHDRSQGCVAITVSATFEPIVQHMVDLGIVDFQVATRMAVDSHGNYLAKVDGVPVEGDEKLAALKRFADARYGKGCWRIKYAYSDHYSDRPLLYAADVPCAVHPDRGLRDTARKNGWRMIG